MFSQCVAVPARSGRLIMQLLSLEKIVIVIIIIVIVINVIIIVVIVIIIIIVIVIVIISYSIDILMTHIMYCHVSLVFSTLEFISYRLCLTYIYCG